MGRRRSRRSEAPDPGRPEWPSRHLEFYASEQGQRVLELEVGLLLERLPASGMVLSVGAGVGAHEARLMELRPGLRVVALDLHRGMLEAAPRHLDRVLADGCALPFRDGSFSGVCLVTSSEFFEEAAPGISEAGRVLAPGGCLVLLALNPDSEWGRARLGAVRPSWSSQDALAAMVTKATGGEVEQVRVLLIEDGRVSMDAPPERAAILLLASYRESDKWAERASKGR